MGRAAGKATKTPTNDLTDGPSSDGVHHSVERWTTDLRSRDSFVGEYLVIGNPIPMKEFIERTGLTFHASHLQIC